MSTPRVLWCQTNRDNLLVSSSLKYNIVDSPSNTFARKRLVKTGHMTKYDPAKLWKYLSIHPYFCLTIIPRASVGYEMIVSLAGYIQQALVALF